VPVVVKEQMDQIQFLAVLHLPVAAVGDIQAD